MKRIYGILLLALMLICNSAMGQQAFYFYLNSKKINAFFTSEVDSIVLSMRGIDGLQYEEYCVQEIWTKDSVFRVPLAEIDSLGIDCPVVATEATEIESSSAILEGLIVADTSYVYKYQIGFIYNDKAGEIAYGIGKYTPAIVLDDKKIVAKIEELKSDKDYYFIAVININGRLYYDNIDAFKTRMRKFRTRIKKKPDTEAPTNVTENSFEMNGKILNYDPKVYTSALVEFKYWKKNDSANTLAFTAPKFLRSTDDGVFKDSLLHLDAETEYCYCIRITDGKTTDGDTIEVKTLPYKVTTYRARGEANGEDHKIVFYGHVGPFHRAKNGDGFDLGFSFNPTPEGMWDNYVLSSTKEITSDGGYDFSAYLDNELPEGEFCYKAFIKINGKRYYGEELCGTVVSLAPITETANEIEEYSAKLYGSIEGFVPIEGKGAAIIYSTNREPKLFEDGCYIAGTKSLKDLPGDGTFAFKVKYLAPFKKYYFRSVLYDEKEENPEILYGKIKSFRTKVKVYSSSALGYSDYADLYATIGSSGYTHTNEVYLGFLYGTNNNLTYQDAVYESRTRQEGENGIVLKTGPANLEGSGFNYRIYGLKENMHYYWRAVMVAKETDGSYSISYGDVEELYTETNYEPQISVSVNNIKQHSANFNISISNFDPNASGDVILCIDGNDYNVGTISHQSSKDFRVSVDNLSTWFNQGVIHKYYVLLNGYSISEEKTFETKPIMISSKVTNITSSGCSFSLNFDMDDTNGPIYDDGYIGIAYNLDKEGHYGRPEGSDSITKHHLRGGFIMKKISDLGKVELTATLDFLLPDTTYYYYVAHFYDRNSSGWGNRFKCDTLSFKTNAYSNTPDEAIDLGLSVKWARHNIGANTQIESGDRFAWGETSPRNEFEERYYMYYNADTHKTKSLGNIRDTEYDAAKVNWGDGWCLPTAGQVEELLSSCQYFGSDDGLYLYKDGKILVLGGGYWTCEEYIHGNSSNSDKSWEDIWGVTDAYYFAPTWMDGYIDNPKYVKTTKKYKGLMIRPVSN